MVDLKSLELQYFCNGYDVPYKIKEGGILNIKPILVKDYPYYESAKSILEIPKNEMGEVSIIQMSYLEFLFNLITTDEKYIDWFLIICKLCLGYEKVAKQEHKNKKCLYLCDDNEIIKYIITPKEFDDICKIDLADS